VVHTFSAKNFKIICNKLAQKDEALSTIIQTYGYPPMWTRPNTFETLVHIILEQQVSLASALAALNKLKDRTKNISPRKILALTDEELRACYVSRQKTIYIRDLAQAILKKQLILDDFPHLTNGEVRIKLTEIKGIGNWTTDVYLMFALQRCDLFPIGDLAAVNALKRIKEVPPEKASQEHLHALTAAWKPYRTIATMILWHFYLSAPRKTKTNLAPVSENKVTDSKSKN
jgi:DNA-3-methyladenine glycosylase II